MTGRKNLQKIKKDLVDKIAQLLPEANCVIHAGDPDEEGQLIVDELLDYLGYDGEVWRVYVNDNIKKNIVKAFDNLKPNDLCQGDGKAAYARQMADKCFGINETRLATSRLGTLFSVGRVQTPTLGLVINRDEAIKNHIKQAFYELEASAPRACGDDPRSVTSYGSNYASIWLQCRVLFYCMSLSGYALSMDTSRLNTFLSRTLAEEREKQGISYRRLDEITGISHMAIQRYLTGEREMKVGTFQKLAYALGLVPWKVLREAETKLATTPPPVVSSVLFSDHNPHATGALPPDWTLAATDLPPDPLDTRGEESQIPPGWDE